MLFNSPLYGIFLVTTWVVFWLLRSHRIVRALWLVVASYAFYFYGTWNVAAREVLPLPAVPWALLCLGIIFAGSTIDFLVGLALTRAKHQAVRNALLCASVFYYLGVLSVFKYWNFAADALTSLLSAVGLHLQPTPLRLALPFGISFFTFETMSYTIDVWRGEIEASRNYLDYLLFVSFFPHLVAGPIVRPVQILPQLAAPPRSDDAMRSRGLWRIAIGLAKKVALGDYLAKAIVDRVFEAPERFTALEILIATYGYAAQIYFDFSGYSDVAIGSAALFGYELPENFAVPYLASSLQEFWHRWHMTLSTWLRDYVYKPLGGSRLGTVKTYRNLMITMLLGGLWHGASWTFVVWGGLHGLALAVNRWWQRASLASSRAQQSASSGWLLGAIARLATFHFVCFAWIFFRAPTLAHAALAIGQLTRGTWEIQHMASRAMFVLVVAAVSHCVPVAWDARLREGFVRAPAIVQGLALAAAGMVLHVVAGARPEPFVYGQF